MSQPVYPLIFTDLDGTLLDHESYDAAPADEMIRSLREKEIADVIPITSKTQAELVSLVRRIPFGAVPRISENGSVIRVPAGCPLATGQDDETWIPGIAHAQIMETIAALPASLRTHLCGFSDMDLGGVAHHTGLPASDAALAKERDASEPFLWSGSDEGMTALSEQMRMKNIRVQRGGRFWHLTGNATKANAMAIVLDRYQQAFPERRFVTIALGDGPNDLEMIEAADYGVIIPNPAGTSVQSEVDSVIRAASPGPAGWVASLSDILGALGCT